MRSEENIEKNLKSKFLTAVDEKENTDIINKCQNKMSATVFTQ